MKRPVKYMPSCVNDRPENYFWEWDEIEDEKPRPPAPVRPRTAVLVQSFSGVLSKLTIVKDS